MSRQPPPGDLLARLAQQALDDDYAAVTARRASGEPPRPPNRLATVAVFGASVAALAVLLTVSVVQTRASAGQNEADRDALIGRIGAEQDRVSQSQRVVADLTAEVERLRAASLLVTNDVAAAEDRLESLRVATGAVPVTGPGIRITVDDAPSGSVPGRILDTDLQLLVNGLWQAGAEAIAVGGQRLTSRSAIRTAGQAITVNYRSLSPPYVVAAIGNPATLSAQFLETSAGQAFADLQANVGVVFDVESPDSLILPGRPLGISLAQGEPSSAAQESAP